MNIAEQMNISPTLVKYLRILVKSSGEFREAVKSFRKEHVDKNGIAKKHKTLKQDFKKLMDDFFIPCTSNNYSYIFYFLLTGIGSSKYHLIFDAVSSKEKPTTLDINCPCIIVQITDFMTEDEWRQIWPKIKSHQELLENLNYPITSPDNLGRNEQKLARTWGSIDFLLDVYSMHRKNMSLQRIANNLSERKQQGQRISPSNATYTSKQIGEKLKQIKRLLQNL